MQHGGYDSGMSPVVLKCPVHGAQPSRTFSIQSARGVSLSNVTESCPKCGRVSAVMEGTYDFDSHGFATALAAPAWSLEVLDEVQGKVEQLRNVLANESIPDDVAEKWVDRIVEEIRRIEPATASPSLADQVEAGTKGKTRKKAWKTVVSILAVIGALNTVSTFGERSVSFIESLIEQASEEPHLEPVPEPGVPPVVPQSDDVPRPDEGGSGK